MMLNMFIKKHQKGQVMQVQCALEDLSNDDSDYVLVLNGDNPLIQSSTLEKMIENTDKCKIMTAIYKDQRGSGRIVLNEISKEFEKIVEEKDCNDEQLKIKKLNAGIYLFNNEVLVNNIMKLDNNNNQNEYYLTDVIEIIKNEENCVIQMYTQPQVKMMNYLEQMIKNN